MKAVPFKRGARFVPLAVLAALSLASAPAFANVFAAHLSPAANDWDFGSQGNLSLSYRLNQPATSVVVEIFRAADPGTVVKTLAGTTNWGLNTIVWDGTTDGGPAAPKSGAYKFRVKAQDAVGATAWTNITPLDGGNEIGSAQYFAPQGIAINKDPKSPFFGQIYISSGSTSLSTNPLASAAGDGLFILMSDMTFRGGSAATAAAAANSSGAFNPASSNSPWKLNINHDNWNEIVMADFSDSWENVWVFNADGTSVKRLLNSATTGPTSAIFNHGNQLEVALTGTGANRKLYNLDEDKDAGTVHSVAGPDFLRYDVGLLQEDYTGAAVELLNGGYVIPAAQTGTGTSTSFYTAYGLYIGTQSGDAYIANRRQNYTNNIAFSRFNLDAEGNLAGTVWTWRNSQLLPAIQAIDPTFPACWTLTNAIAADEARGRGVAIRDGTTAIAAGCSVAVPGARAVVFNTENGAPQAVFTVYDAGAANVRDAEFDAAGNLYTSSQATEQVRMWSPPDGPNSFTTTYFGHVATSPLKVTLEQAAGQADPSGVAPVNFTVTFSAPVTGFTAADVTIGGTAGPTGAVVTGGPTVYNIAVTGMSGIGTVTASIGPDVAVDAQGNPNQPSTSVDNTVLFQAPESVGKAKSRPDGTVVSFNDVVITSVRGNEFFVQDQERSGGVRVVVTGGSVAVQQDQLVSLLGTTGTAGLEKVIYADAGAVVPGEAAQAEPLLTSQSDLGGNKVTNGDGLSDDGLLVTVWGTVTYSDFISMFYIDDGSGALSDSTTHAGLKVDLTGSQVSGFPSDGNWLKVTGIVRLRQAGDNVIAVLEPRTDADIVTEM